MMDGSTSGSTRWEAAMTEIAPVEVTVAGSGGANGGLRLSSPTRPGTCSGWAARPTWNRCPGACTGSGWPTGSTRPGGSLAVEPPHLVVFSWGFADDEAASRTKGGDEGGEPGGAGASASAMPASSTRVTVTLAGAGDGGTLLTLRHENLPSSELREGHDVAWNTYLPRLVVRAAGRRPRPRPARLRTATDARASSARSRDTRVWKCCWCGRCASAGLWPALRALGGRAEPPRCHIVVVLTASM